MSVVGFDDAEISRHLHPRLTTLIQPHRATGGWAAKRLSAGSARLVLECTLVTRNSVAAPQTCILRAGP